MSATHLMREAQRRECELRADLRKLMAACPYDGSNPQDCPLFPVRKMKRKVLALWGNGLDEDALAYVVAYHHVCLNLRVDRHADRPRV